MYSKTNSLNEAFVYSLFPHITLGSNQGMYTSAGHLVNINLFYGFFIIFINSSSLRENHAMLPALDAILGHKSAHSLETGPVMAEPFISP